jgi:ATP-dependent protease ClpP protease subunit
MPDETEPPSRRIPFPIDPRARYRIEAKADTSAEVWIYDDIGWLGTTAQAFARELRDVTADAITVHLNSPGGDAFDGIAIYNSLRDHLATVTVVVDGLAASAASVIAMAGDKVRMNRGAQMMIHEASGLVIGNAGDMTDFAAVLDKTSQSLAEVYAARAGGTVEDWRTAMRAETWYTAAEAVEAGLADELADDEAPAPQARASWDLSTFRYAGREQAPAPVLARKWRPTPTTAAEAARLIHAASTKTPTATAAAGPTREGAGRMDPAKIREALGLAPDVSDEQVFATLASARPVTPSTEAEPTPTAKPAAPVTGTMTIDVSAWNEQQVRIKRLEAADARRRRDERDQVIAQAVADGKFAPARTEHWARLWDADPEGTRQVIDGLARNVIPVAALGYDADRDGVDIDEEFASLFPPAQKGA